MAGPEELNQQQVPIEPAATEVVQGAAGDMGALAEKMHGMINDRNPNTFRNLLREHDGEAKRNVAPEGLGPTALTRAVQSDVRRPGEHEH